MNQDDKAVLQTIAAPALFTVLLLVLVFMLGSFFGEATSIAEAIRETSQPPCGNTGVSEPISAPAPVAE